MEYNVADILSDFAFYGHIDCPMTCQQIERARACGLSRQEVYDLGCDVACGFRFNEALDLYLTA